MAATSGYQAAVETNQTQLSYGVEATWNTAPATTFQALRIISESLSGSKTRNRPSEILSTREVSAAVTTAESASGTINYALSWQTVDDLISSCLGNDWQAAQTIAGAAADITITTGTNILSSSTAGKFTNIAAGQYINLIGFTNTANNGVWFVSAKTNNQSITLAGPRTIVTETPTGTNAQVRASNLANGTQFKSLYIQQKFSSSIWLRYGGAFVSKWTIQGGVGQFIGGSFDVMAASESSSTTDASTGGITAAPSGRVHDPIGGFGGILWNNAALSGASDSFSITVENVGAAGEYGMGSATAQGMLQGTLQVTGSLKMFFKSLTEYANFKNESLGRLTVITKDPSGNAYVVSVPQAALMNPKVEVGGPNQPVYASFDIEGNPQAAGGTITVDRLPAT